MNPFPSKNSVLVLDNAKIHHDQELLNYLDAFGVKVEFLPPYSPDLNPIDQVFSKPKALLPKVGGRTIPKIWHRIRVSANH